MSSYSFSLFPGGKVYCQLLIKMPRISQFCRLECPLTPYYGVSFPPASHAWEEVLSKEKRQNTSTSSHECGRI